ENGSEGINEWLPLAEHHFDFFRGRIVGYHKVVAFFVRLRSAIRRGLSPAGLCDSGINSLSRRAIPVPSRQFFLLDSDTAMGTRGSQTDGVADFRIQSGFLVDGRHCNHDASVFVRFAPIMITHAMAGFVNRGPATSKPIGGITTSIVKPVRCYFFKIPVLR